MRPPIGPFAFVVSLFTAAGVVSVADSPAWATGTVQVQQNDGSSQFYKNATIVVSNKTLRITTADKKGTLIIDRAACQLQGKVLRCLPYSMTLDQGGGATPLDFKIGTVYLNTTNEKQPLPPTSEQLPPNGIMLSLTTRIGTIVNVTGTIDKQTK
jgi:hypothetical protein